jgi:hypothetical protein
VYFDINFWGFVVDRYVFEDPDPDTLLSRREQKSKSTSAQRPSSGQHGDVSSKQKEKQEIIRKVDGILIIDSQELAFIEASIPGDSGHATTDIIKLANLMKYGIIELINSCEIVDQSLAKPAPPPFAAASSAISPSLGPDLAATPKQRTASPAVGKAPNSASTSRKAGKNKSAHSGPTESSIAAMSTPAPATTPTLVAPLLVAPPVLAASLQSEHPLLSSTAFPLSKYATWGVLTHGTCALLCCCTISNQNLTIFCNRTFVYDL